MHAIMYIRTCIKLCIHCTFTHINTHTHTHVHTRTHTHTHTHTRTHTRTHTHTLHQLPWCKNSSILVISRLDCAVTSFSNTATTVICLVTVMTF